MRHILNVGNTHVLVGDESGKLLRRFPTSELTHEPLPEIGPQDTIFAGCVVPELRRLLNQRFPNQISYLRWQQLSMLDFSTVIPETMGADRLANAVMLSLGPLPAICLDFGTAIHSVAVDANRRVVGGFILPGRQLMRNALASGTAQLPSLNDAAAANSVLGTTTPSAMAAGIDHGTRGAVAHLISRAVDQLGGNTRVVLAGGDAPWFSSAFPNAEIHGGTFTLQGLAAAAHAIDDDRSGPK